MKHLFSFFLFAGCMMALHAQTPPDVPHHRVVVDDTISVTQEGSDGDDVIRPSAYDPQSDTTVFSFAEEMPEFPGGDAAWNKYLADSIRYPAAEKAAMKSGTVYVTFIVETDGSIRYCKEAKGVVGAPGLGKEACRVVLASGKWIPAKMNGRAVRCYRTIPVNFVL